MCKLYRDKPVIIAGDLNVVHTEIDLRLPYENTRYAGFMFEERDDMTNLLGAEFADAFRFLYPDQKDAYTFWSYLNNFCQKNFGWPLDYFVISERFKDKILDGLNKNEVMGNDHCPVVLSITLDSSANFGVDRVEIAQMTENSKRKNKDITGPQPRNYLFVILGEEEFKALYDTGAQSFLCGPRVAKMFKYHLKKSISYILNVNQGMTPVVGILRILFEVDHKIRPLALRAVPNISDDILLGMDFVLAFDPETQLSRGQWHLEGGK